MSNIVVRAMKEPIKAIASDLLVVVKSMGHQKRLQIMIELLEHSLSFQSLLHLTELKKTALSHHLKDLMEAGLIEKPSYGAYAISLDGENYLRALYEAHNNSLAVQQQKLKKMQSRPPSNEFIRAFLHLEEKS